MAVDFKTEHTRTSEYLFLPSDIKINPDLNGRHDLPDIEWLVESMVSSGQLQPVLIGNDGGKPVLYAGHSRWRAALEINKRSLTPVPFKLRCVYFRGNEHQAFLATIRENRDRNATTPIDDARNIAKLERYGMTVEEIAEKVYHEDPKWVKERLALIELCDEGQKAVANKTLKPSAAVALAKLSKDAQRERLKSADETGRQLTAGAIKRAASPNGTRSTAGPSGSLPAQRKWDKRAFCELVQQFIDMTLPPAVAKMDAENAVRTVLAQLHDEIKCGQ